jgi:hypothetical protein
MAGNLVSAMESGLFLFIAHPDNFGIGYIRWDENAEACAREIISAAARTGIPLEINGYGFRKDPIKGPRDGRRMYPIDRFWEIAAETGGIRVVCNSDAHTPADVYAAIAQCREIAARFGLEYADLEGEIETEKGETDRPDGKPFPVKTRRSDSELETMPFSSIHTRRAALPLAMTGKPNPPRAVPNRSSRQAPSA